MREIKFRAWDGEQIHCWDSVTHRGVDEINGTPFPKLFYLPMSYLLGDSNDWHWMQYTGLKDKNGKEIYEGDIIQIIKNWVYEVIWSAPRASFCLKSTERKTTKNKGRIFVYQGLREAQKGEVIGNIYENPELIK